MVFRSDGGGALLPVAEGIQAGSALDAVRDLAGSIHGPGDLSYNKAHLRDFGRH